MSRCVHIEPAVSKTSVQKILLVSGVDFFTRREGFLFFFFSWTGQGNAEVFGSLGCANFFFLDSELKPVRGGGTGEMLEGG